MDVASKISGFSRSKNIEEYSNSQEISLDVDALTQENFILTHTAEVFERYLRKRSPALLVGVERFVEMVPSTRSSLMTGRSMSISSTGGAPASPATMTRSSTSSSPHGLTSRSIAQSSFAAYRINPMFKLDMVEREIEEGRITMDKLRRKFESAKFLLQTEEETLRMDTVLLEEGKTTLEQFVTHNSDKKTGRVFHDKFLRFLENELQTRDRDLRKMKLKTKSYQNEYNRMLAQQQQKLELRERLHPIDIDKLLIENEEHLQVLEQKTKTLLDLKKAVGKKGQNLVSMKSKLNDTILLLKNIKNDIKQKETKYTFIEAKEIQNVNELITAEVINQNIKRLNTTFKSPDVHSYLMVEVKLSELKSEKETWERRCKYQRQNISLLEHQIKQLSPSIRPRTRTITRSGARSVRTSKSPFSSKSAESVVRYYSRGSMPIPHCTPTTPTCR